MTTDLKPSCILCGEDDPDKLFAEGSPFLQQTCPASKAGYHLLVWEGDSEVQYTFRDFWWRFTEPFYRLLRVVFYR